MTYNWQDKNWPNFIYYDNAIANIAVELGLILSKVQGMVHALLDKM